MNLHAVPRCTANFCAIGAMSEIPECPRHTTSVYATSDALRICIQNGGGSYDSGFLQRSTRAHAPGPPFGLCQSR